MTRRLFTRNIASLLAYMISIGEEPFLDYILRSSAEQQRLYGYGRKLVNGVWVVTDSSRIVTYRDGIVKKSAHQLGIAADIYLWNYEKQATDWNWDIEKAIEWHKVWELKYNGKPMILWDCSHFEG